MFMLSNIKAFAVMIAVFTLAGCGFHFQESAESAKTITAVKVTSSSPYDYLTRAVRQQLQLNHIQVVEGSSAQDIPVLNLNRSSISSEVASVFKQGKSAEKLLILNLEADLTLPGKGSFPLDVRNSRTFFDDGRAALAKSTEQEELNKNMELLAAKQLVIKLITLDKQISE